MKVVQLFIKPQRGLPVVAQEQLALGKDGIRGDIHAQVGSPRQLLIVDQPLLERFGLQSGDLQENILLDDGLETLASGHVIGIGETLIRPTFRCEPCAYLETVQQGLTGQIGRQRGWLAIVVRGGTIALETPVISTSLHLPVLPDDAKGRFYEFVARIPPGKVVTTAHLILALGVTKSHYRVIPAFMRQAAARIPAHRIVAIDGGLFVKHLPDQAQRLAVEGVEIVGGKVCDRHYWQPQYFHLACSTATLKLAFL